MKSQWVDIPRQVIELSLLRENRLVCSEDFSPRYESLRTEVLTTSH
jgi:hypothetical protein